MNVPGKILIVQTAFIGDVILITPLIRAVKSIFPDAAVDALVIPQTAPVLENNPWLENVITFDKRRRKIRSLIALRSLLRSNAYDLVLTPHSSLTTGLLLYFSSIPRRVGFRRGLAAYLLTDAVPHRTDCHKAEKNLDLLSPFSGERFPMQTELFPDADAEAEAERLLDEYADTQPLVAIAPGSVWATKRWPKEYYIELTRRLSESAVQTVFIGGGAERGLCAEIIEAAGARALNLAGRTTLLESAAVVARCALLVSNDSGALHIANAMRTDVFAFFGPTVRRFGYYPFRENDRVFETDLSCRPCGSHGGRTCPLGHHDCMKMITPNAIIQNVLKKLKS
jgi:heptosyltransferase II